MQTDAKPGGDPGADAGVDAAGAGGGTRRRNRWRTRRALAEAAVELFEQRGYEAVTMADVADRAGVSRRTAFRHVGSKDELLLLHPREWLEVFDRLTAERADLAPLDRLRVASHAVAAHIESDPEPVRRALLLAFAHPGPAAGYAHMNRHWVDRVAEEIGGGTGPDPARAVQVRLLAAAVMGMIEAVCDQWASGAGPMVPLIDAGFDLLAGAFVDLERPVAGSPGAGSRRAGPDTAR